jgi:hypothetical protein
MDELGAVAEVAHGHVSAIVDIVNALGGLKAVAISHPHYYTTMVDWSAAYGGIPVYLHAADERWIMRSVPWLQLWAEQTREILPGVTLIRVGGHFDGARCCTGRTAPTARAPCFPAICCR